MTARAQPRELEHFVSLGAEGVIAKPFDPMTLAASVRNYVGGRRRRHRGAARELSRSAPATHAPALARQRAALADPSRRDGRLDRIRHASPTASPAAAASSALPP